MHITPHLHVVKDFWNPKKLWISKNLKFHIFYIVSVFWTWVIGYIHLQFFTIKIMLLQ